MRAVYTSLADALKKINALAIEFDDVRKRTEDDDIHDLCCVALNGFEYVRNYLDDVHDEVSSMEYEIDEAIGDKDWYQGRVSDLEYEVESLQEEIWSLENGGDQSAEELIAEINQLKHDLSLSIQF